MVTSLTQSRYPDSKNPNSVEDGLRFQDFGMRTLQQRGIIVQQYASSYGQLNYGESIGGTEFKLDRLCGEYGRLSIEIAEKSAADRPEWTASGIFADPRPLFYVQGNFTQFWYFDTNRLIELYRVHVHYRGKKNWMWDETATVRKFYMPLTDANRECVFRFVNRNGQMQLIDRWDF